MSGSWGDATKVGEYLERMDRDRQRQAGESVLLDVIPRAPRRVLDLGCGDGRLAALVMGARPTVSEVIGLDSSEPMLDRARERFAEDDRVRLMPWNLEDELPHLGRFDLVVSGFAIHHVGDARKRELFTEIAALLYANGVFANLEVVMSATPELHAEFRAAIGRECDDPEDRLCAVEPQLAWMRDAGLEQVDCMWRWRGFALLVGRAPTD